MSIIPRGLNSTLVVAAWINSIPSLRAGICATQLPDDNATWGTSGFITVQPVGGFRDVDLRTGRPVMQVNGYAVKPNTQRPPWHLANNLVTAVRDACELKSTVNRILTLPTGYAQARVESCYQVSEERRLYGDDASVAIYTADFQFHWVGTS